MVAGTTAVAFVMIVATVVWLWQAQRAESAATQAKRQAQRAEAVSGFSSDLFRASGSQQRSAQQARSMTAVEFLERGATTVGLWNRRRRMRTHICCGCLGKSTKS